MIRPQPEAVAQFAYERFATLVARFYRPDAIPPRSWAELPAGLQDVIVAAVIEVLCRLNMGGVAMPNPAHELSLDEYAVTLVLNPYCADPAAVAREVIRALDLPTREHHAQAVALRQAERTITLQLSAGPRPGERLTYDNALRRARKVVHAVLTRPSPC